MSWELYQRPQGRQGAKTVASLNASSKVPILLIGQLMKDAGFDVGSVYVLYFDRETLCVGLMASDTHGFKVSRYSNQATVMRVRKFCEHFGLKGRYVVRTFEREDDMWVLPLTQISP